MTDEQAEMLQELYPLVGHAVRKCFPKVRAAIGDTAVYDIALDTLIQAIRLHAPAKDAAAKTFWTFVYRNVADKRNVYLPEYEACTNVSPCVWMGFPARYDSPFDPLVSDMLQSLSDEDAEMLVGSYVLEQSSALVASRVGVNQSTVVRRVPKIVAKLRARYDDVDDTA